MAIAFVTQYGPSANNTTTPKTVSPTLAANDFYVVGAFTQSSSGVFGTPSGGGLTYTSRAVNDGSSASGFGAQLWTAPSASSQSFTLSETRASGTWELTSFQFTGVLATGNTASINNSAATAATTTLTTTVDHSAIVMIITDSSAGNPTLTYSTATAGTFTEVLHTVIGGLGDYWMGYYLDAGTAGVKTIGATNTTLDRVIVAVELTPASAAGAAPQSLIVNKALRRSTLY